ncbi:uncharacterized protein LOC143005729 [Genypterus blacodes]|uniref:uncharacterized protein LOC143005729 n=1 Tax=Genypterus blacodes TaxID=154954 RepID=UPI003F775DA5
MPLKCNPRADGTRLFILKGGVVYLLVLSDMIITSRGNQTEALIEINLPNSTRFQDATDSTHKTIPQPTDPSSLYDMITRTIHPDVTSTIKYGDNQDNELQSSIPILFAGEDTQELIKTSTTSTVEAERDESPPTFVQTYGSYTVESTARVTTGAFSVSSSSSHTPTDPSSLLFPSEETADDPPDEESVTVPSRLNNTKLNSNDSVVPMIVPQRNTSSSSLSPTTEDYNNTEDTFWIFGHSERATTTVQGPTLSEESPSSTNPQITPARGNDSAAFHMNYQS